VAVALIEANDITVELGANRERAEERLFDYFRGRFSGRRAQVVPGPDEPGRMTGSAPVTGHRPTGLGTIAALVSYKKRRRNAENPHRRAHGNIGRRSGPARGRSRLGLPCSVNQLTRVKTTDAHTKKAPNGALFP